MQATKKAINKYKELLNVNYLLFNNQDSKKYQNYENKILKSITEEDIKSMLALLDSEYDTTDDISLLDDLVLFDNINPVTEKLKYILLNIFLNKEIKCGSTFENKLVEALRTQLIEKLKVESTIRTVYLELLESHIKASSNMSDEYKEYLNRIKEFINFKYSTEEYLDTNAKSYIKENIRLDYISSLIKEAIKYLLILKDENLEDDYQYAKAISIQILLRSLLSLINEEELIQYDEYYNLLSPKETIAKSIVRTAFIEKHLGV